MSAVPDPSRAAWGNPKLRADATIRWTPSRTDDSGSVLGLRDRPPPPPNGGRSSCPRKEQDALGLYACLMVRSSSRAGYRGTQCPADLDRCDCAAQVAVFTEDRVIA